jgi:hypothetical protein
MKGGDRVNNTQIMFLGSRVKVIKHTPQWRVDHAVKVVGDAYSGKLPFHINEFLPPPKVYKREHLSRKWLEEHRYDPTHDHHTYKLWRKNLNMIRDALKLLYREGIIDHYHVDGSGTLHVKWFTKWVQPVRVIRSAMRTGEKLQRVDVFAKTRHPEIDQYLDTTPDKDPYHHPMWRVYDEIQIRQDEKVYGGECIVTKMQQRHGQADVLRIIERAYVECDFDTLHQYDAPLSCDISEHNEIWATMDFDASAPKQKSNAIIESENTLR